MFNLRAGLLVALLLFVTQPVLAGGLSADDAMDQFKAYLNNMATEVKQADDPKEKRAIMDERLRQMQRAIDMTKQYSNVSSSDKDGLKALYANIADKRAQLNGSEDYEQIADIELDEFADYVQQDLEQAQRLVISIGATTLAIILLLLLLL